MKIKVLEADYDAVMAMPRAKRIQPKRPSKPFRMLLKMVSAPGVKGVEFECNKIGIDKWKKDEPALILMNHSSFIDLQIASTILYPHPFNIVCTSDGFVGKQGLMHAIGCIPTQKFVTDTTLVKDLVYTVKNNNCSVLMYPEASYSFDGTATPLPKSLGKLLKLLKVPVIMIKTYGAFSYDPLYNCLQTRKVKVTCDMKYLLSSEDISAKTVDELNKILEEEFDFDGFKWQQDNKIKIDETFRADGLNRVLYKCSSCEKEGTMTGKGTEITCEACGKTHILTEYGYLEAKDGETRFNHIPDWYKWEREEVKKELDTGTYNLDIPVDIIMMVNTDAVYRVGEGRLQHNASGFHLTGCDGRLDYTQIPKASYSLYSDYYWYEIGDMICIGNQDVLYYCFPKGCKDIEAKTRLATEELFKIVSAK